MLWGGVVGCPVRCPPEDKYLPPPPGSQQHTVTTVTTVATETLPTRPPPGNTRRGPYQYGGDDERLVGQGLRHVDVQAGGVHGQGVVGEPHADL